MPMKPGKGESQSDFMARCMKETFTGDRKQDQAVAICMSYWRDEHGGAAPSPKDLEAEIAKWSTSLSRILGKQDDDESGETDPPEPQDDETQAEYMDRCTVAGCDEDDCQMAWDDYQGKSGDRSHQIVHKTHTGESNGMEFILSDETPDRMGDVIMSTGWDLRNFQKNPIALFNHRPDWIVGRWHNLRIEKGSLRGNLELAPEGTSPRIDEIRKLVEAKILRAVSVGFRPIKQEPRRKSADDGSDGYTFTRSELVETSLVSIPANPNALSVAKSLDISPATLRVVFAEQGDQNTGRRSAGSTGGHADKRSRERTGSMATLSQRIKAMQQRIVDLKDSLQSHLDKTGEDMSDEAMQVTNDLNARIAHENKALAALQESERQLGGSTAASGGDDNTHRSQVSDAERLRRASFFAPPGAKKLKPLDYLVRSGVILALAKAYNRPVDEARVRAYGEDEATKIVFDMTVRAASTPATTTATGWAVELVQTVYADFMDLLYPNAIYPRLAGMGLSLSFGRAGKISVPSRAATPTVAGSFVGEGQPIPVRQAAFATLPLVPKKLAVITTWTREIDEHSVPAIEGLLRAAIQEDTGVAIDTVLIDANPATTVRPAGLLNSVAAVGPTAGGGLTALVGDIKLLTGAVIANTKGNLRKPAWLMNPGDVNSGKLTMNAQGEFPFKAELQAGNLNGFPVIDSGTVPLHTMIFVDAADFVAVGAEGPRFEISDQATLHEEDTSPAPIVGGGTAPATASPVRSLWQTDSLAIRLIQQMNWVQRRAGTIAWTQNMTW